MNASESPQTTDSQSGISPASPLEGLQVLLAEDCPDQGRLYLKFLQTAGATVTLECTGQSAVDTIGKSIRRSTKPFDAVVMDFQMPELDGLDATLQLRELGYEENIVAVTAYDTEELRESWFQAGCNEFLNKPLNKAELISAILRHAKVE